MRSVCVGDIRERWPRSAYWPYQYFGVERPRGLFALVVVAFPRREIAAVPMSHDLKRVPELVDRGLD
jgi:hypothetical protein